MLSWKFSQCSVFILVFSMLNSIYYAFRNYVKFYRTEEKKNSCAHHRRSRKAVCYHVFRSAHLTDSKKPLSTFDSFETATSIRTMPKLTCSCLTLIDKSTRVRANCIGNYLVNLKFSVYKINRTGFKVVPSFFLQTIQ